jgi:hypothetical protein
VEPGIYRHLPAGSGTPTHPGFHVMRHLRTTLVLTTLAALAGGAALALGNPDFRGAVHPGAAPATAAEAAGAPDGSCGVVPFDDGALAAGAAPAERTPCEATGSWR